MVATQPKPTGSTEDQHGPYIPPRKGYRRQGGRPGLNVDFVEVCDAVQEARKGNGQTMLGVAGRFGVSRAWLHKWVSPALQEAD